MPQVAVVTGGSSGIGAAIARSLAGRGWHCVLLARSEERLRPLAEELGAECETCDVGDRAAVERMAAAVRERHPKIGLLVNNAGIPGRGGFLRASAELIEEVTRDELPRRDLVHYAPSCPRWRRPRLRTSSTSSRSLARSSTGAGGPYSASKHAQLAFSRAIRGRAGGAQDPRPHGPARVRGDTGLSAKEALLEPALAVARDRAGSRSRSACWPRSSDDRGEVFVPRFYRTRRSPRCWPRVSSRAQGNGVCGRPATRIAAWRGR